MNGRVYSTGRIIIKEEIMKNKHAFFVVLTAAVFCIMGCATGVPYSFVEDKSEKETATITFITRGTKEGVDLHYFEDKELPIPVKKNYWAPIRFPAGRPFKLTVNIYHSDSEKGNEKIFNCPALIAGKDYKLEFSKKKTFLLMTVSEEKLVLTDMMTGQIVYEQDI